MLHRVDSSAHQNRWRRKTGPVAVLCAGLMGCALLLRPWPGVGLTLIVSLLAATVGARVPPGLIVRALMAPLGFVAASSAAMCVALDWSSGVVQWRIVPGAVTTAASVGLRAFTAASVTLMFAMTVPMAEQLALLRRLRVPEALLELMLLTYRSLFLLDDARSRIMRAQRARLGYRSSRIALHSTAMAGAALFRRTLHHAVRMERGLAARGYRGRLEVLMPETQARLADYACAVVLPCGVVALATIYKWAM